MAQIRPVTSEALEAQIRKKLPSQNGFTEDLQAQNVIVPVIDLSETTAASSTPLYQQQALAFGSITSFDVTNTTTTLANSPGFWAFYGESDIRGPASGVSFTRISLSDGSTTKLIWQHEVQGFGSQYQAQSLLYNFIVFLNSGESVVAQASSARDTINGNYRQLADVNGDIVFPSGFTPQ